MIDFYKINKYLFKKTSKNRETIVSYIQQKQILDKIYKENFQESYFSRSYCQYLCQKKLYKQNFFFLNFLAFFVIYFILYFFQLCGKSIKKDEKKIIIYFGREETIPKKFLSYKKKKLENKFFLIKKDIEYFKNKILKKSEKQYYFALKILLKIGVYRYNIEKNDPNFFLVTSEYSWTSSIMTEFCELNKIFHINYMHGDKSYLIRDSFFRFHECYVWDDHYKNVFCELKAFKDQFVTINYIDFIPLLKGDKKKYYNTYYLQYGETIDEIDKIVKILKTLKLSTGYEGKIRCHPIYTIEKIKNKIPIEMLDTEINIYSSLLRSYYIIAKSSTVLYEAFIMNTGKILIDDITRGNSTYTILKELKFISIFKTHQKLSEIVKEEEINE